MNPGAAKLAREQGRDPATLSGTGRGGRVTVEDVVHASPVEQGPQVRNEEAPVHQGTPPVSQQETPDGRAVTREPMSPLRQRIAARLLAARQQTAMLTTFNEADLGTLVITSYSIHYTKLYDQDQPR